MNRKKGSGLTEALFALLLLSLGAIPLMRQQIHLQIWMHALDRSHKALHLAQNLCDGRRPAVKTPQMIDGFHIKRQAGSIYIRTPGRNGHSLRWKFTCA